MKARLNITIEDNVLSQVKAYAASKHISISRIVEDYLRTIAAKSEKKESILDLVDGLEVPSHIDTKQDLKKVFYEDQSAKYGF
ncbi:DUF6364 family protein [Dyadobacter chenhuakuii]|uniref:DUF6364 family protein n=1 Tax=Dyadobacter chenhuakuii TaxID=2909339 RepID=A0A9X1TU63_9BACT|nr:DUF6364 family protein [Dyadobacter chenhuakuii]MCF2499840.1 DUF6364 family protein [Dyadobacter chenhuakuii]